MDNLHLRPGFYLISKISEKSGSIINLEKLIVHEEAFAFVFQGKPLSQFCFCKIRKDAYESRLTVRAYPDDSICTGYHKLPIPPFEIIFENHIGSINKKELCIQVKDLQAHPGDMELIFRSIPVNTTFAQETENQFYVERVVTGQFIASRSYSVLRGNFAKIKKSLAGYRGHVPDSKILRLDIRIGNENHFYTFDYDKHTKCIESFSYIPPGASISYFKLVEVFSLESGVIPVEVNVTTDPVMRPFNAKDSGGFGNCQYF